jgi:hypothetical protein
MLSGGRIEFGLADGDGNEEDQFCLLDVENLSQFVTRMLDRRTFHVWS